MSLLLLFRSSGAASLEFRKTGISLISGHVYKLSYLVRSDVAQSINTKVDDSAGGTVSLNQNKVIRADRWETIQHQFTAGLTDSNSRLRVTPEAVTQNIYFDKFRMIDYTIYKKNYRLMRIQGSMFPGSFVQTLTLREVTAAETA